MWIRDSTKTAFSDRLWIPFYCMKMFFSTRHKRIFSPCQKQTLQSELLRNPSPNTSLVSINIKNIFSSASSAAHFTRNASDLLHAQSKTFFFFPVYVPVALTDVTPLFVSSATVSYTHLDVYKRQA